jgi:uncharacterized SAM-binding protein YcdF (DUF218 family)
LRLRAWHRLLRVVEAPLVANGGGGARAEVIVVLGAALVGGRLGPALERRVRAGVRALNEGRAARLVMTGAFEAEAMRARAVELGAPAEAIWCEPHARTTRENALRCAELLAERGVASALVVTQPYHTRRSVAAFRRAGILAEPLAADGGGAPLHQIVREYIALAGYTLRGWV